MNFTKAKLSILFLILGYQVNGQGVSFFNGTWEECKATAKKENKAIFIDAYTDWCGWCKVMDKKTFTNDSVGTYFKKHFIAYKMDMERSVGIKVRMKFKVNGFPSFLFLDKNGNLIKKSFGYQEPSSFLITCKEAIEKPETYGYNVNVNKLFLNYPQFFIAAHQINDARKWPAKDTVIAYLNTQTNLFSEVNWAILSRFSLDSSWNQFFLSNTDKYKTIYGADEVDGKVASVVFDRLRIAIKEKNEVKLAQTLDMVDQYKIENAEANKIYYKSFYYKSVENWTMYAKTAEEIIATQGYKNLGSLNDFSWTIYKNVDNKEILIKAVKWMKEVVALKPVYMYIDTYAALLYKSRNLKEAKKQAKMAIDMGEKNDENTGETKELLKKINKALRKSE